MSAPADLWDTPIIRITAPWSGDPAWVVEKTLEILKMNESDPDVPRIQRLAQAVMALVAHRLDCPVPFDDPSVAPIPDPIAEACVNATVEAYRRKDAPFGIVGAWSADGVSMRVSRDWLDAVYFALQPYRQRFGIA